MTNDLSFSLEQFPVHLGRGATARRLPAFTGDAEWYERYESEYASDGDDGRLVTLYTFTASSPTWEMHPRGDELVVCVSGELHLTQDIDGESRTTTLTAGDAIINAPGVWHTIDVDAPTTGFFITAGWGTTVRPR